MSVQFDQQRLSEDPQVARFAWRWLLVLVCVLSLAMFACDSKKSSSSSSGGSSGGGGGGGGASAPNQVQGPVKGGGPPKTSEEKAQKVVNQLSNYLLGITATQGAPADLAAAKQAVRETNGLNWPNDPWGKPYVYTKSNDTTFQIFSAGPDGQEGTPDDIWPM